MILLSIIIPAHNEQRRIARALYSISTQLRCARNKYEILVVANGCTDQTVPIVKDYRHLLDQQVHVLDLPARGKGLAVRTGMLAANGAVRYMCDADLSTPIKNLAAFITASNDDHDIVIGSREIERSQISTTASRRIIGRIFNFMASQLVPGISDTQCGFKLFKAQAAEDLFARSVIDGMAFDVEILHLAMKRGYSIKQIPVTWVHDPDSKVRMVSDSSQMAVDLIRIWLKHRAHLPQVKKNFPFSEQFR